MIGHSGVLRAACSFAAILICGCASGGHVAAQDRIQVASVAPYVSDAVVSKPVHQKCELETRLPEYVANEAGGLVQVVTGAPQGRRVLNLRIAQAVGVAGGAWSGSKSVTVEGELVEDGRIVGSFRARDAAGQFGNGWSSTCHLLAGCTKSDAEAIAKWLRRPTMNARLGDTD